MTASDIVRWAYFFSRWAVVLLMATIIGAIISVAWGPRGWLLIPAALVLFGPPTLAYFLSERI